MEQVDSKRGVISVNIHHTSIVIVNFVQFNVLLVQHLIGDKRFSNEFAPTNQQ